MRRYLGAALAGQVVGAYATALFAWAVAAPFPDWSTNILTCLLYTSRCV